MGSKIENKEKRRERNTRRNMEMERWHQKESERRALRGDTIR